MGMDGNGEEPTLSIIGLGFRIAYQLRRHFWLAWPLSRWLGLALVLLAVLAARNWRPDLGPAAGVLVAWLLYSAFLVVAGRSRYLYFRRLPGADPPLPKEEPVAPLSKLELVPARASGWFSVEGQGQHFVDLDAEFETTGIREHIVLARVHPSRFLLVGGWPGHEVGWWYIFFHPPAIRRLALGHLHVGPRPRLAVRVDYSLVHDRKERLESVFMTFPDAGTLHRVWEDLVRDAPPGAIA
jgi:hypothetical protein